MTKRNVCGLVQVMEDSAFLARTGTEITGGEGIICSPSRMRNFQTLSRERVNIADSKMT